MPASARNTLSGWRALAILFAALTAVPLVFVFSSVFSPSSDVMSHLSQTMLAELLMNTLFLVVGVTAGTLFLGVGLAWITSIYEFPGSRFFSWALMLPLAIPAYVMAFVFLGLFDFMGPVQTMLRGWFGSGLRLPDINSTGGVIIVMTLVLYPYVYLLTKNAFMTQGRRLLEASRMLGLGGFGGFRKVMLPMARPWIASGLLLVVMETLADFGTVSIFNYNTFTTAIYKAWFGFFSLEAAAQLSSILVVIALVVLVLEQKSRSGMRFTRSGREATTSYPRKLKGAKMWAATVFAGSVFFLAFIVPVAQLALWSFEVFKDEFSLRYLSYFWHTLLLGVMSATVVCTIALLLAYAKRLHDDRSMKFLTRISTLGYALPGTILAVGIFIPVAKFDNLVIAALGLETSSILKGTVIVLVAAYAIRFMAAGFNAIDSALQRIGKGLDEVSWLLGRSGMRLLMKVHVPLLRGGIVTAAIMVLVDVMKEMPITLMMRPFGWDTLAVKIFELTSEGEWERAALSALALVATGLIPVILLTRQGDKR
jgi:iron(III) transport system permease protein